MPTSRDALRGTRCMAGIFVAAYGAGHRNNLILRTTDDRGDRQCGGRKKSPDNTVRAGAALPGGKAGTPKARKPDPSQHTGRTLQRFRGSRQEMERRSVRPTRGE